MKKRRIVLSDREQEKIKRMNRRKTKDPYDGIRRDVAPVGYPIDTGKGNKKVIRSRERSFIEMGLREYYEEDS